jgi:hypothetical protein
MNVQTLSNNGTPFHAINPILPIPPGTQLFEINENEELIEILDPYNPSKNARFIAWEVKVPGAVATTFKNNKTVFTLEKPQDKFKGNFGLCVPHENGDSILDCITINNTGLEPTLLNYVKLNSKPDSNGAFLIIIVLIALALFILVKLKF